MFSLRWHQLAAIARRQAHLLIADRCYFAFLTTMPVLLASLALIVPGNQGFGPADPTGAAPNEPAQLLILLNISAVFMGTALTIRDLVGERNIFDRERAIGLSATAYILAKVVVYSVVTALQALIFLTIVLAGKGGPQEGALVLCNSTFELYVGLAATAIASALVGLGLSSLASKSEHLLPMLVITTMFSIVFAGGLIPVTGRSGLEQLSWLLPARWGFAASASTADLQLIAPLLQINDYRWNHEPQAWMHSMLALLLISVVAAVFTRWRLRMGRSDQSHLRIALSAFVRRRHQETHRSDPRKELTSRLGHSSWPGRRLAR